jgi:integrase
MALRKVCTKCRKAESRCKCDSPSWRYQIDYYDPAGKRIRKDFKKKKDAETELAARVVSIGDGSYFEKAKTYETTFEELVEKYIENFEHQRSFKRSKSYMIEELKKEFKGYRLKNISYLNLETYRNKLRNTLTIHGKVRTDATVNRYMACLRHMLAKAVSWDMVDRNPFDKGESLQLKENNQRLRYLTEEEIERLLAECPTKAPPRKKGKFTQGPQAIYLRDFVTIAVNTGMRKGEILSLKWDQIRGDFVYLEKTKTDEARQIPINDDLDDCFKSIRKRQPVGVKYIFRDQNGHIKDIKTAFNSAIKRAGIQDFRPHDLRHTFASHYVMRGGSLPALQKILGHADIKMTMRYAHLSKEFAREEIKLLNGLTSGKKKADGHEMVTNLNPAIATTG